MVTVERELASASVRSPNGLRLPDGTVSMTVERGHLHGGALRRGGPSAGHQDRNRAKRLVSAEPSDAQCDRRGSRTGPRRTAICPDRRRTGIHSRTRHLVDPAAPSPGIHGSAEPRRSRRGSRCCRQTPEIFHMIFGPAAHSSATPCANSGDVYWFANMAWDGETTRERLGVSFNRGVEEHVDRSRGGGCGSGARHHQRRRPTKLAARSPCTTCRSCRSWHGDSMVIIGDAAHATSPSSGQGASMAIEDAIVPGEVSPRLRWRQRRRSPPMSVCGGHASSAWCALFSARRAAARPSGDGRALVSGSACCRSHSGCSPAGVLMRGYADITSTGASEWSDGIRDRSERKCKAHREGSNVT